eukprot:gene2266-2578_t
MSPSASGTTGIEARVGDNVSLDAIAAAAAAGGRLLSPELRTGFTYQISEYGDIASTSRQGQWVSITAYNAQQTQGLLLGGLDKFLKALVTVTLDGAELHSGVSMSEALGYDSDKAAQNAITKQARIYEIFLLSEMVTTEGGQPLLVDLRPEAALALLRLLTTNQLMTELQPFAKGALLRSAVQKVLVRVAQLQSGQRTVTKPTIIKQAFNEVKEDLMPSPPPRPSSSIALPSNKGKL